MDKRFEQVDTNFTRVFQRLDEISIGADVSFELLCASMIKSIMKVISLAKENNIQIISKESK